MKRVVVPIDLGGSPTRCVLSPPLRPPPEPDVVEALIHHYKTERMPSGDARLEVAFFRGGLPSDELLEACDGLPVRVACSPADLSRGDAKRLWDWGVETVQLDLLTFQDAVLRGCGRGYTSGRVKAMIKGLKAQGFQVGATLAPGLPGGSHVGALADVELVAEVDHVRLIPVLALEGSEVAGWVAEGRWQPMSLAQAITTLVAQIDRLDALQVLVVRVGLQPGNDLVDRVVAGPVHPNLRGLVEGRRFRKRMTAALVAIAPGQTATLRINPKDLGWAKGMSNQNVRSVRIELGLEELVLLADASVGRGDVEVA